LTFDLICERGVANVDAFSQNMAYYSYGSQPASWIAWGSDADQAMIAEFLSAIAERRAPSVTGYDGYKAIEVALAAYRSAELGQPVALPLF
jgi:predicted dehydrogenase